MRIVRATPADAARLTRIAHAAKRTWGYPEAWVVAWKGVLTITSGSIRSHPTYCARVGRGTAGFCSIRRCGALAVVDHLWVAPAYAGRGIGRALFRHCETWARRAGAKRLAVESDPHAEGFYRAMGARRIGRRPAPIEGVQRYLPLMKKRLA
jgi:GNAT superfamily N-acetyltransferase